MSDLFDHARRATGVDYDRAVAIASGDAEPATPAERAVADALREGWDTARAVTAGEYEPRHAGVARDPFAGLASAEGVA